MHWRFTDRVDSFEPWEAITGRKGVSFEEYSLLEPFGRRGKFPESLIVECCVELARWLVAASSGFEKTCVLEALEDFVYETQASTGAMLEVAVTASLEEAGRIPLKCTVCSGGRQLAAGGISVRLLPLAGSFDPELVESMWRELNGAA